MQRHWTDCAFPWFSLKILLVQKKKKHTQQSAWSAKVKMMYKSNGVSQWDRQTFGQWDRQTNRWTDGQSVSQTASQVMWFCLCPRTHLLAIILWHCRGRCLSIAGLLVSLPVEEGRSCWGEGLGEGSIDLRRQTHTPMKSNSVVGTSAINLFCW